MPSSSPTASQILKTVLRMSCSCTLSSRAMLVVLRWVCAGAGMLVARGVGPLFLGLGSLTGVWRSLTDGRVPVDNIALLGASSCVPKYVDWGCAAVGLEQCGMPGDGGRGWVIGLLWPLAEGRVLVGGGNGWLTG